MRLIDADAFNDWILSHFAEPQSALILTLQGFIAEQPTAYDIDKVIEELEMEMKASSGYSAERVSAFSRAIEIVKHGGVDVANNATTKNDDVCEWRKHSICGFYSAHEGAVSIINIADGYKYCPYCGKKIKLVE